MKSFLLINCLLIFLVPFSIKSQDGQQDEFIPKKKIGRWEIAYGTGSSYMGSNRDIYDHMVQSGLGEYRPPQKGWIFDLPGIDYPIINKGVVVHYSIKYNFSQREGIKGTFGVNEEHSVTGYRRDPYVHLTLHSKVQGASFSYVRNLKNGRHSFAAGPSLIFYSIGKTNFNKEQKNTSVKPGFHLGYSFKLLNGKNFFLQLEPNYTWAPKTETGSFSNVISQSPSGENQEVLFQSTKASLSTFTFEISFGFKLGRVE